MIYFVQLPGGTIKIGYTADFEQRMAHYATSYAGAPIVLHTMPGDQATERELHDRFAHLRMGDVEQFKPGPDLMTFIGKPLLAPKDPDAVDVVPMKARNHVKLYVTMSPQAVSDMERLVRLMPDLFQKSQLIAWALRMAVEKLENSPPTY